MISEIFVYRGVGFDPYINLASEKYLTDSLKKESAVLYLWQNRDTVVVGTNQNPWAECRCEALERDGGYVARRMTGGGAVFHDVGNLNFSFICEKENYDLEKQLSVIVSACKRAGIDAQISGRNDITADGRKFSGNAFLTRGGRALHHGTLLIDSDVEKMTKYLSPPQIKLASKGIRSVSSRVVNLSELCKGLTAEIMAEYMQGAFEAVYGMKAQLLRPIPTGLLQKDVDFFSDRQYIYGKTFPFTAELEGRIGFENVKVFFNVKDGIIVSAKVYTDSLDTALADRIEQKLCGKGYSEEILNDIFSI